MNDNFELHIVSPVGLPTNNKKLTSREKYEKAKKKKWSKIKSKDKTVKKTKNNIENPSKPRNFTNVVHGHKNRGTSSSFQIVKTINRPLINFESEYVDKDDGNSDNSIEKDEEKLQALKEDETAMKVLNSLVDLNSNEKQTVSQRKGSILLTNEKIEANEKDQTSSVSTSMIQSNGELNHNKKGLKRPFSVIESKEDLLISENDTMRESSIVKKDILHKQNQMSKTVGKSKARRQDLQKQQLQHKDIEENRGNYNICEDFNDVSRIAVASLREEDVNVDIRSLDLDERLINVLTVSASNGGFGISQPTVIQRLAIPPIRDRSNVIIRSETGSGKTLCYLLPLVQNMVNSLVPIKRVDGTRILVVAPTRELCHQIVNVANKLVKNCVWLVPGSITGGEKRKSEKARLRKGIVILVATPGRLLDHLKNTQSFSRELETIVLDEADRLLDMGFEKTIREILSHLESRSGMSTSKRKIQKILASATYDSRVRELTKDILGNHTIVDAARQSIVEEEGKISSPTSILSINQQFSDRETMKEGLSTEELTDEEDHNDLDQNDSPQKRMKIEEKEQNSKTISLNSDETLHVPDSLRQHFTILPGRLRLPFLSAFCNIYGKRGKIVVFLATCDSVDFHHAFLQGIQNWPKVRGVHQNSRSSKPKSNEGPSVYRLHANLKQQERMDAYYKFVSTPNGVLFCTDVAARGLDLPAIDWILQYDTPNEVSDYIHRIGRTARSGRSGKSTIILYEKELSFLDILRRRGMTLRELKWQDTARLLEGAGVKETQQEELLMRYQKMFEQKILDDKNLLLQCRLAFQATIRAYAAKSTEVKKCFVLQNLHLGHLATSFGLKEPPKQIKVNQEILKNRQIEKKNAKSNKMLDYGQDTLVGATSTNNDRDLLGNNTSMKSASIYSSVSEFAA